MELNERMVAVETRLDSQDSRLNKHDGQLENLRMNDVRLEAKLDGVCHEVQETKREVTENTEMTRSIKDGVKTIKWLFGLGIGLYTLYEIATKLGWL